MLKFVKKCACLAVTSIISILAVYAIIFFMSGNITGLAGEVFYSLDKAGENSGRPAVILGDSVCNQLWAQNQDSENFSHIGCNQAITPCGTWLLLKKYLEHNPQTKEVYYIVRPQTLANDMWLNYTYQYFVIPFVNNDTMKIIEPETMQNLYMKFGKLFVENDKVKNILLNNNFLMKQYLSYVQRKPEMRNVHRISRTAVIYLAKIRELCDKHNVTLYILPLPLPDTFENHGWENFNDDARNYGFEDILGEFVNKIFYCPEEWYIDGSHFKHEILDKYGDEIRASILKQ